MQSSYYWSSSALESNPLNAWNVDLYNGFVVGSVKVNVDFVWPVRGGR